MQIPIPPALLDNIRSWTSSYGKVKLVLKHNRYFLESSQPDMLQRLLRDPVIKSARAILPAEGAAAAAAGGAEGEVAMGRDVGPRRAGLVIPGTEAAKKARLGGGREGSSAVGEKEGEGDAAGGKKGPVPPVREEDDFFKGVGLGMDNGEFTLSSQDMMRERTRANES